MNLKALGLVAVIGASSLPVLLNASPALAWNPSDCANGVPKTGSPALNNDWKWYCQGVSQGKNGAAPITNITNQGGQGGQGGKGGNATATGGNASQNQHQSQGQTQALNNRINQSLANSGNSNVYNSIHQGAQLPMVNAPECGGVNVGGSLGYDEGPSAAVSAAMHFGRRSDTCNHYDAPAAVTYVQAAAPVVVPAPVPIVERHETVRTVYVHEHVDRCPSHLTSYDARRIAIDLHKARVTKDTVRIRRDRTALEAACREDLLDTAIDGAFDAALGH